MAEVAGTPMTETVALVRDVVTQQFALLCVAKRTYAIGAGGRLSVADEQVPLVADPEILVDEHDDYRLLLDDTDLGPPKQATDVVLTGTACAPQRARELFIAVAVAGAARRLVVSGERHVEVRPDGTVRFSSPEPFERVQVTYEHAYGGYDGHAHQLLDPPTTEELSLLGPRPLGIYAYPRNAAGLGYFLDLDGRLDRRRADGARLPLIEDPSDLLTADRFFVRSARAWLDAPIPGALGWLHHAFFPRVVRYAGSLPAHDPPSLPIREIALGEGDDLGDVKPLDYGRLHPRALQGSAPGLARERLRGDEPVVLQNLHPTMADLRFELPGEAPRFALRPPDVKLFTPAPMLQTVRLEPDEGRVSLCWSGVVPLFARTDEAFLERCDLGVTWTRL